MKTVIAGKNTIKAVKSGPGLTAGKRQNDVSWNLLPSILE
jgi:hypothetical protein